MDKSQEKTLTSEHDVSITPTHNELRMLQNLRDQATRWPHGQFGPVFFITHSGKLKHGIFKETENTETRI